MLPIWRDGGIGRVTLDYEKRLKLSLRENYSIVVGEFDTENVASRSQWIWDRQKTRMEMANARKQHSMTANADRTELVGVKVGQSDRRMTFFQQVNVVTVSSYSFVVDGKRAR